MTPAATQLRRALLTAGRGPDEGSLRDVASTQRLVVDDDTITTYAAELTADLRGFGPLQPFLADPAITDIAVNGASEVWVDRGDGMVLTPVQFADDFAVRKLAQRLAVSCGRRLDDASPYVDAALSDGIRLHAMLPPLVDRVSVAIRIPRHRSWGLEQLVAVGMITAEAEVLLRDLIQQRRAFLVTGGTGSGKTTLLNALLSTVSSTERLILVEDTRELAPVHPHVVRLQTRAPNIEGAGGVTLQHLVRQTLRMRPDRLVVGEVRGAEVIDLLTAFNTGHQGGCGTVHANSATDVVPRLEALGGLGGLGGLGRSGINRLIRSALDAVVHLERDSCGRRRLAAVAVLVPDGDYVRAETAFTFAVDGSMSAGPAAARWHAMATPT